MVTVADCPPPPDESAPVVGLAAELARSVEPALEISTCTRAASPAQLLVNQAYVGPMVVLGNTGGSALRDVLAGSICGTVAAAAPCPVITVSSRAVWPDAPVVVGVTDPDTAVQAIEFGFELADRRCVALTVHRAGRGSRHARRLSAILHRLMSDRGPWARRYPRVAVTWQDSQGDAVAALATAAAGAQLLVIGSPRCGPAVGAFAGSVGHALLRTPPCPLAVIPPNWLPTPLAADGTL
jgi:nucleotide-binding universal stress UspA family protein